MNILQITTEKPFKLSTEQLSQCSISNSPSECLAYISSHNIQTTTCGTHIYADNVFPQRDFKQTKIIDIAQSPTMEIYGSIANQSVISTASKTLVNKQKLTEFCEKRENIYDMYARHVGTVYSDCKHIKFLVNSKDISIAK
jgi:hypothetical protein